MSSVPQFIPIEMCEKILFIGKAMLIFKNSQTSISSFEDEFLPLLTLALCGDTKWNKILLNNLLSDISNKVSQVLYHTTAVETQFINHLHSIKSYLLVSNGEFYNTLIEKTSLLTLGKLNNETLYGLNVFNNSKIQI